MKGEFSQAMPYGNNGDDVPTTVLYEYDPGVSISLVAVFIGPGDEDILECLDDDEKESLRNMCAEDIESKDGISARQI